MVVSAHARSATQAHRGHRPPGPGSGQSPGISSRRRAVPCIRDGASQLVGRHAWLSGRVPDMRLFAAAALTSLRCWAGSTRCVVWTTRRRGVDAVVTRIGDHDEVDGRAARRDADSGWSLRSRRQPLQSAPARWEVRGHHRRTTLPNLSLPASGGSVMGQDMPARSCSTPALHGETGRPGGTSRGSRAWSVAAAENLPGRTPCRTLDRRAAHPGRLVVRVPLSTTALVASSREGPSPAAGGGAIRWSHRPLRSTSRPGASASTGWSGCA